MKNLSNILSSIDNAVWSFDLEEKKFIYVNDRLADIYELPLSAIEANPSFWLYHIHPEDHDYVLTETKRAYEGFNVEIEYRLIVNNRIKWVRDKKVVVFGENGKRKALTGILADITEKKKAENDLTDTDKILRYLFINNPNPLWIYDCETLKFLAVNHSAIAKYGYSKDEFLSMSIADILPWEDGEKIKDRVKNIKPRHYNTGTQWTHRKKNGELIYVDLSGHGISFKGRDAELVMAHDITQEVESRNKITLAKQNLDALINNIEEHIWSIDANYNILSANLAYKNFMFDITKREIAVGESIFIPELSAKGKELWLRYYNRALNGEAFEFIELVDFPNMQAFFAETRMSPIRNNNEIIGVACISSNIQERLETQKRIIEQNKKLLEVISIASHEIRGPIASLLGLVDVFNQKNFSDPFNAEIITLVQQTTRQVDSMLHTLVEKTYALQQENQIKYSAPQNQLKNE